MEYPMWMWPSWWIGVREDKWLDIKHWHLQDLPLIWLKALLEAFGGRCSPTLFYADKRLHHHAHKNSPLLFQGVQTWPQQSILPSPEMGDCFEWLIINISVSHSMETFSAAYIIVGLKCISKSLFINFQERNLGACNKAHTQLSLHCVLYPPAKSSSGAHQRMHWGWQGISPCFTT